jgi:hypothetical protein
VGEKVGGAGGSRTHEWRFCRPVEKRKSLIFLSDSVGSACSNGLELDSFVSNLLAGFVVRNPGLWTNGPKKALVFSGSCFCEEVVLFQFELRSKSSSTPAPTGTCRDQRETTGTRRRCSMRSSRGSLARSGFSKARKAVAARGLPFEEQDYFARILENGNFILILMA